VAFGKLTLIILHSSKSKPKTITLSPLNIALIGTLIFGYIGFSIFVGFSSFLKTIDHHELSRLEKENSMLRNEIENLTLKIEQFEETMAEHVKIEEQLRILANLDPVDSDVWRVGIGGPDLRLEKQSEELRRIPSIRPVDFGYISSGFGDRLDPFTGRVGRHEGVDFSARKGAKVFATADGVVRKAGYEHGYGYTVEIDHGNGIVTRYAHNGKIFVRYGQKVKRGDVIALVGSSGRSTAPHLHYEVRVGGIPQNPLKFILPTNIVVD